MEEKSVVRRIMVLSLAFQVFASSCNEPATRDFFIAAQDSPYEYEVDMSDSLAQYDLEFYTMAGGEASDVKLDITWISPERDSVRESVYLPDFGAEGIVAPYRSGVVPPSNGVWILSVEVPEAPDGFCGLGLTVTKKKRWATEN